MALTCDGLTSVDFQLYWDMKATCIQKTRNFGRRCSVILSCGAQQWQLPLSLVILKGTTHSAAKLQSWISGGTLHASLLLSVCYKHMGVSCPWVRRCRHLHTLIQRLEKDGEWFSLSLGILFPMRQGFSLDGKLAVLMRLVSQLAPRIHLSCLYPQCCGYPQSCLAFWCGY